MEFKVSELEREPVEFDLALAPGTIDFGEEAEQVGHLAASGRAEVIHEHRGPKEIVADIRLKGSFRADSRSPAPAASSRSRFPLPPTSTSSSAPSAPTPTPPNAPLQRRRPKSVIIKKTVLLLEDVLREQVLLSLPVRTLCKPDCKGLCPRCGANRNLQPCSCDEGPSDPRWEALAGLRSRIKS